MSIWRRIVLKLAERYQDEPLRQPVFWTLQSVYLARAYSVVASLGIADLLANVDSLTCAELAAATGANEDSLYRIMRALAGFGFFAQTDSGLFKLTPRARVLVTGVPGSLRDWTLLTGGAATWTAFGRALDVVRTGRNGFEVAHGADLWAYGEEHAEFGELFVRAQDNWTEWQTNAILAAFDFGAYRKVVDVGCGRGRLTAGILLANTSAAAILYDRVQTIEWARALIESEGLAARSELVAGDFLERVPEGGDLYLLKHVLRDWNDGDAVRILANCRAAMPETARLLVIDAVMDPANDRDRVVKLLDLEQMFWLRGRLRTLSEWQLLFGQSGFRIAGMRRTAVVDAVIVECLPQDR